MLTLSCLTPAQLLNDAPYSLPWGSSVFARVLATNIYGSSEYSVEGNNGVIVRIPDAPINLAEDIPLRTPTELGLTWSDGSEDGGLTVLDYRINIALEGESFAILESNVVP